MILRELPLKNFYARASINAFFFIYLAHLNWKCLPFVKLFSEDEVHYYPNKFQLDEFENYPLLKKFVNESVVTKTHNTGLMEYHLWNEQQFEPFYMHHQKNFRYIFRTRRVVPWDGTYNQPVFPYLSNNDRAAFVHNGVNEIHMPSINPSA